jgi:hypothetical protein
METIVEKIVDETLFKKDSWLKRLLRRFSCRSSCCANSQCSLEPEDIINEKNKQKQEIMDFVKILRKKTMEGNDVL